MFDGLEADILILQETKINNNVLDEDMVLIPGWDCYFSLPKNKKGGTSFRNSTALELTLLPNRILRRCNLCSHKCMCTYSS